MTNPGRSDNANDITLHGYPKINTSAPYGWRGCPLCNGRGVNPVLPTHVCPRCNGEKKVPR